MNQKQIGASVFYAKKNIDNAAGFECAVLLTPVHEVHRAAYSFTVETCGESATIEAATYDRHKAERIFDRLICEKVSPHELDAFIRSFSE